jgi:hypothetical protein
MQACAVHLCHRTPRRCRDVLDFYCLVNYLNSKCSPHMTLDEYTGGIMLPEIGASISASLLCSQFLQTLAFAGASVLDQNEPWCSYRLPEIAQAGSRLCVVLQFHGEQLQSLTLYHDADRFGTSWSDWSEERELARKAFHEDWLTRELGIRLGHYPWGDISSNYDPKGGSSSIIIRYS